MKLPRCHLTSRPTTLSPCPHHDNSTDTSFLFQLFFAEFKQHLSWRSKQAESNQQSRQCGLESVRAQSLPARRARLSRNHNRCTFGDGCRIRLRDNPVPQTVPAPSTIVLGITAALKRIFPHPFFSQLLSTTSAFRNGAPSADRNAGVLGSS